LICIEKAMEFAETVPAAHAGSDDSWPPGGAQEFFIGRGAAREMEPHCVFCC
jgi:hypothetical protein